MRFARNLLYVLSLIIGVFLASAGFSHGVQIPGNIFIALIVIEVTILVLLSGFYFKSLSAKNDSSDQSKPPWAD